MLIDSQLPRAYATLEPPNWLRVILFVEQSLSAPKAKLVKEALPSGVSLREGSKWALAAAMLALGLSRGVRQCISFASEGGVIERERARFISGYWEAKAAALQAGALAFNISSAGPSLFAFVEEEKAEGVVDAVVRVLTGYKPVVTRVAPLGAIHNVESKR